MKPPTQIRAKAREYAEKVIHQNSNGIIEDAVKDFIAGAEWMQQESSAGDVFKLLIDVLREATDDTTKTIREHMAQVDWFNNNTPGVGQKIDYARATPMPEWVGKAEAVLKLALSTTPTEAKTEEDICKHCGYKREEHTANGMCVDAFQFFTPTSKEDMAEDIAQWVIDNRHSKGENQNMSDFEIFHILTDKIKQYATTKEAKK